MLYQGNLTQILVKNLIKEFRILYKPVILTQHDRHMKTLVIIGGLSWV
jgi:hypothetical protein